MRIAVDHVFTVTFPFQLARAELALRVTPDDHHDQTVSGWRIGPDCDARLRTGRDGYGNILTMLYAEGPLDSIDVHVSGEVFTGPSSGILSPAHAEPLPPRLFLRPAPAGGDGPDRAALAVEAAAAGGDALDRLHLANVALHDAAEDAEAGVLATAFVAAARRMAVPARCVSGYLADRDGVAAPHLWAEAYVDAVGWIGFDPLTGLAAGEDHVRVANALDAAGVAMIVGT